MNDEDKAPLHIERQEEVNLRFEPLEDTSQSYHQEDRAPQVDKKDEDLKSCVTLDERPGGVPDPDKHEIFNDEGRAEDDVGESQDTHENIQSSLSEVRGFFHIE